MQLVNNYAFTPALNDKLSLLFLDLKEGTKIISLKPFVSENFRLTERTVSCFAFPVTSVCANIGLSLHARIGYLTISNSQNEGEAVSGRMRELDKRVRSANS